MMICSNRTHFTSAASERKAKKRREFTLCWPHFRRLIFITNTLYEQESHQDTITPALLFLLSPVTHHQHHSTKQCIKYEAFVDSGISISRKKKHRTMAQCSRILKYEVKYQKLYSILVNL